MTANVVRFYFDGELTPVDHIEPKAFEDVPQEEADAYEAFLLSQSKAYTRIDL
jgi:hypothetical protein